MKKIYGLPYKGSKNAIAEEIIDFLPSGNRLVDLFGGGGAISHCASLSGKWNRVYYNELNPLIANGFKTAINGGYDNVNRWVSHEEFFRTRGTDYYNLTCFSYCNDCRTYAYGTYIEPWMKALHYARVFHDYTLLEDMGIYSSCTRADVLKHNDEYLEKYIDWFKINYKDSDTYSKDIEVLSKGLSLERLRSYENLLRLRGIGDTVNSRIIEVNNDTYLSYNYKKGDIVYCDPPYENTHCDAYRGFNNAEFFDWVASRPYQVFFSEYEHDYLNDRFYKVWQTEKREMFTSQRAIHLETIYSNQPYQKKNFFIFGM